MFISQAPTGIYPYCHTRTQHDALPISARSPTIWARFADRTLNVKAALARDSLNGKEPSLDDPASMTLLPATHHDLVSELVRRWRADPGATYRSWFLWDERLKNFRSIRRGLQQVVAELERGRFGVAYRGPSLATGPGGRRVGKECVSRGGHAWA